MPGLDALRGVAVLLVVLYHGLYWDLPAGPVADTLAVVRYTRLISWGWLGVTLFFVLSGFLITGILLDTRATQHYWKNFYLRRLLRIFPALVLLLAFLWAFEGFTWQYVLACLAYMGNVTASLGVPGPIYNPLWSLAVEEQFYLVWPWLVRWLPRWAFACVAASCLVVCPLLRGLSFHLHYALGDPHGMTYLIADHLAMGACLALFLRSGHATLARCRWLCVALLSGGALLLAASVPLHWLHRNSLGSCIMQAEPFLWIFTGLLLLALLFGDRPWVLAATRPLRSLGHISYGLYLCHLLPFEWFDHAARHFGRTSGSPLTLAYVGFRFATCFALAVALSTLSRRYYEAYFLRLKRREAPYVGDAAVSRS